MQKYIYDWKPDLPDTRDQMFTVGEPIIPPMSVDLESKFPPVFNQGTLGSCSGNALAGAIGYIHPDLLASRLFIYYNERSIEGTIQRDSGAFLRDGIKSMADLGVCQESTWPYMIESFENKPSDLSYIEAMKFRINSYSRILTLADMINCLAAGFPFVFGFTVYPEFEGPIVAATGEVPMPTGLETSLGGHAVLAVGYDISTRTIKVRNSWGSGWGKNGYFTLPFDYISNPNLASDFWTIRA